MTPTTLVRSPDALWHRTSRRVLVNPARGGPTFELHGIHLLVWDALAEPVALDDLVADLVAVFDQPEADVRAQVGPLVDDLMAAGVVECH